MTDKTIILLDMDCFYVQVEERDNPEIKGKPAAVVQYNTWKGGGIIAVNYEARSYGVKRGMRGDEAKEKCPSIHLIKVPVLRGKADLTKYRNAGKEVISVLCEFSDCVERASIDEAYIDLTKIVEEKCLSEKEIGTGDLPSTWVIGFDEVKEETSSETTRVEGLSQWLNQIQDLRNSQTHEDSTRLPNVKLSVAAVICEKIRKRVLEVTKFKCSAGISHSKMLGKLACGLHKPNQQSILPMKSVSALWSQMPIGKVRNLGGKLGDSLTTDLNCTTMSQLSEIPLEQLRAKYDEKTAFWLHCLGQGIDNEPVMPRQLPKSIGCGKNFNGKEILNTKEKVSTWMKTLSEELSDRLYEDKEANERLAKSLAVHARLDSDERSATSRSCPLTSYQADSIARTALSLISSTNTAPDREEAWIPAIRNISLSASKFEDLFSSGTAKINDIFKKLPPNYRRGSSPSASMEKSSSVSRKSFLENSISQSSKGKHSPGHVKKSNKNGEKSQKSFFLQFLANKNSKDLDRANCSEESTNESEYKDGQKVKNGEQNEEKLETELVDDDSLNIDHENLSSNSDTEEVEPREPSPVLKSKRSSVVSRDLREDRVGTSNGELEEGESSYTFPKEPEQKDRVGTSNGELEEGESSYKFPKEPEQKDRVGTSNGELEEGESSYKFPKEQKDCLVSIQEIFPDLDNVDPAVLALLPPHLQEQSRLLVDRQRSEEVVDLKVAPEAKQFPSCPSSSDNKEMFKFCRECRRKILSDKWIEHCDFHFASELRKQQLDDAKSSVLSPSKSKRKSSSDMDAIKSKKLKKTDLPVLPIDQYFRKKST